MMRIAIAAVAATGLLLSGAASAAPASCAAQAKEKKLAGAAETSFMKKCEADSTTACTKQSTDKKLAGAAKSSFEKKCVEDAVGKAVPAKKS